LLSQLELLRRTDWAALIVLDACRADVFHETTAGEPALAPPASSLTARSPGVCTPAWLAAVGPLLAERNALYFTANPVVDREVRRRGLGLDLVSVWRRHWARFTSRKIPSVHPFSVNGVVLTWAELGRLARRPIVVHYLQPHSPYVGEVPLAMARWGRTTDPLGSACHRLPRPDRAARDGRLDWGLLRRAYRANLALAWRAALHLARSLDAAPLRPGPVVVTADHGELLGEDGRFGHECHWEHEALRRVPWLVLGPERGEGAATEAKLRALGYA
jgi:hypothetical protein